MTCQRNATAVVGHACAVIKFRRPHARRLANNHPQSAGENIHSLRHGSRNGLWCSKLRVNGNVSDFRWVLSEERDQIQFVFDNSTFGEGDSRLRLADNLSLRVVVGGGNQNAKPGKNERKSIHDQKSNQSRRIRICVGTWFPVMSSLNRLLQPGKVASSTGSQGANRFSVSD